MKATFFALFSLAIAACVFNLALCLTILVMQTIHWNPNDTLVAGLSAFILPALASGMMLTRVEPFFAPCLTAPIGSTAVMSIIALSDSGAPIGVCLGLITLVAIVTLAGCLTPMLIQRRQRPGPPTQAGGDLPSASPA